ncbi:carbohydrate ABC transporter permease [Anaerocellum diazotrophicum]|uniref:Sugar ABC transporter permease n=1 Tax=Caldicellulosiruptor diazotrophicus TaxID=2806205 RepID=A0ABM7NPZ2_9FIRM|nr:carbohydrate ABC transporter permease [Caldicellulosiruptor diazotrophicus]BCS82177.1 sugar ABC transporter permease [Caldicellulosiruptor diazotrophicus]
MFRTKNQSSEDRLFDTISYLSLIFFALIVLYPLYFIIIASISDPDMVSSGQIWFLPKGITFDGYKRIFEDNSILLGYRNTLIYAGLGAIISVAMTVSGAYPLARKDFYGRNFFMAVFVFTMFFGGGLIPTYLLVKSLGMLDTIWAMVIPGAVSVWNLIITRTFFQLNIPEELREAAFMDGCSDLRFFVKIVLPLSRPIIAVLALFAIVGQWNGFFDALIYLSNEKLYPLQLVLRKILIQSEPQLGMMVDVDTLAAKLKVRELIKYSSIVVSSVPVLIIYPFIQKYFVKGVMIGSIKG